MDGTRLGLLCVILFTHVFLIVQCNNENHTAIPTLLEAGGKDNASARLPTSLLPIHYNLRLQPFIHGNHTIHGTVEVSFRVLQSTDKVTLNMADIVSLNDTVRVFLEGSVESLSIVSHTYHPGHQTYTARLGEAMAEGRVYTFRMDFVGLLNNKLVGFYRSSYKDRDGIERRLALTQFSPTDARRAFPCFDEPAFKASFDITIARQANMTAVSNMPVVDTSPLTGEEGWVADTFNTTLPMSTYLVGFMVCDFHYLESSQLNNTLLKVWSRPEAVDQAEYALGLSPTMLTFLEQYFSIPFPLPKLDMAAVPDFKFNGMENWGLILYRETALLYESGVSSAADKQGAAYVVAHELGHQWFGNLVTPAWWSDLWLKEGFASFMGYVALDYAEPSWNIAEQFVKNYQQSALALDSLKTSHPISVTVNHPDEISEIFDTISYNKGASIIRMMQHFLTEPTFRKGLTNYLQDLKYSNAEQDDLWRYLSLAWHEDTTPPHNLTVKDVMDTWTLQMAYPVINVTRNGAEVTFTQERFQLFGGGGGGSEGGWWVPVAYTTQAAPDFTSTSPNFWMTKLRRPVTITNLTDSNNWIVVNVQAAGYYRVNYDEATWMQLIQQLKDDHTAIHQVNRAQMLDDAFNLARAGYLNYTTVLDLTSYLTAETDFVPWSTAFTSLAHLHSMFQRTAGYGTLRGFLLDLLTPLYELVGFEDLPEHPHLTQYRRVEVVRWACRLGHTQCVDSATKLYKEWLAAPAAQSVLSANTQRTVMCTGVSAGGEAEWDATWTRYLQANVASQKNHILAALACTKEIWLLSRYLDRAFSPSGGIRKQDAAFVFASVANNPVGRDLAWNFLQNRWSQIFNFFGPGSSHLSRLIKAVGNTFNSPQDLKELELFRSDNSGELGSAVRALDQTVEAVQLNVAWMDSHYHAILHWLTHNGRPDNPRKQIQE